MRTRTNAGRTHRGGFAIMMICLGVFGAVSAKDAISGNQDWERDAYLAVIAWAFVGFLATYQFFLSRHPKSVRLITTGAFSVGLGLFILAGTVLIRFRHTTAPAMFVFAGAFFIMRGIWLRRREASAASSETAISGHESEEG